MLLLRGSILYILIFFFALVVIALFKYPFQDLSDQLDPYYHIAHASAYLHDTQIQLPQLTHFSTYPADLWFGYHLLLAASFFGTDADDVPTLITRTIVFHIVCSALLVTVIARLGVVYFRTFSPFYAQKLKEHQLPILQPKITEATLITIMLGSMFLFSLPFFYRTMLTERPHVVMILFVTIALLCLLQRHYQLLAVFAGLSALCYSMSLTIFIPATIVILGWLITDRSTRNLSSTLTPFLYTALGYAVGVSLHPDTWGYLLNGVLFTSYATLDSIFWFLPLGADTAIIPAEMQPQTDFGVFLIAPLVILTGIVWYRSHESTTHRHRTDDDVTITSLETGFCATALLLGVISLLVSRGVEYSVPLLFITTITFVVGYLVSLATHLHRIILTTPGKFPLFYHDVTDAVANAWSVKTVRVGLATMVLFLIFTALSTIHVSNAQVRDSDRLKDAVEYLITQTDRGLVVFNQFHLYPQAILYGPTIRYAIGMDQRMTYFYDASVANGLDVFATAFNRKDLPSNFIVDNTEGIILNFLRENHITHILIDLDESEAGAVERIESYSFLHLQYQSERYPEVRVYRVNLD